MGYEIRYLLMIIMALTNQFPIPKARRKVDWDEIVETADYQRILNLLYLATLGMEKEMTEEHGLELYEYYQKLMLLATAYNDAEEVIRWQLEFNKIETLVLTDTSVEGMYRTPEMADMYCLEFLIRRSDMMKVHKLMREMDYDGKPNRVASGMVYKRHPGIEIFFYTEMPGENEAIKKFFSDPVDKYLLLKEYRKVHGFSQEESYIYRIGDLVNRYILGNLKVRDILNFWQFRQSLHHDFPWKNVMGLLEKAKWLHFQQTIVLLGTLWFGHEPEGKYSLAMELEEYIFEKCKINDELDWAILPHESVLLDFYRRNRDAEWAMRKKEWLFPSLDYMKRFFPVLEKHPRLLRWCRLLRLFRFWKRFFRGYMQGLRLRNALRVYKFKQFFINAFRREKKEPQDALDIQKELAIEADENSDIENSLTEGEEDSASEEDFLTEEPEEEDDIL